VDELPADRSRAAGLAVAGDAVTDLVETAELLDVDVDQLARMLALIAADRFGRLERRNAIEAKAPENPADGRRRHPELGGDLLAGPALPAQRLDPFDHRHCGGPMQAMRPRGAILQSLNAFSLKPGNPFACRPRADPCGSCGGLRRLPAQHRPGKTLSTPRRQTGILVDVHPVLPGN